MTSTSRLARLGLLPAQLILAIVLLLTPLCAAADERIVTVGIYENPPKIFTAESGKPAGIFIDLIEQIASSEGWQVRYVSGTWGEILDHLARGEIDLVPDVAYSADRAKSYSFHKVPALSSWFQVYAPRGNTIHTVLDLNGQRILVLERSIQQEAFFRLSRGFGLNITVVPVPDYTTMFETVARGEADAAVTNSLYGKMHAKKYGLEDTAVIFEPSDLFYAAPKGDPKQLLASIDRHLADLKSDHQSVYYASLKRWTAEEVRLKLPLWLQLAGAGLVGFLIISLIGSVILRHQVNTRTRELHKEKEALRASEREYRQLVMLANSIILRWSPEGRITFLNEFGLRFFGYTAPEILGRYMVGTLVPEQESEGRDLRSLIQGISADPRKFERNINENVRRNGERVWIDWTNKMVLNEQGQIREILSIGSDITARMQAEEQIRRLNQDLQRHAETLEQETRTLKQTEKALRLSEGKYRRLHQSMTDGFVYVDLQGNIRESNAAYRGMLGYTGEELSRLTYMDLTPAKWRADEQDIIAIQVVGKGYSEVYEKEYQRKDGSIFPVELKTFLVCNDQGEKEGMWAIVRDLTERKQAEKAQKALEEQLYQAQKMESVGRLAGGVAHDFNNMLSVILSYAQMGLEKTDPGSSLHGYLQDILDAAERSASITRQLLAFARRQTVMPQVLDLNTTVDSMLKMLRRLIGAHIPLTFLPQSDLWPIKIDPAQIDQLLANLCINSRDAITGAGTITIETGMVTFDASYCAHHAGTVPGEYVLLMVSDNGCGMERTLLDKIFEPFFTTKELGQGTGLGLATVYGIVKQNNGSINVYSEPGKGTTFRVYLPRHSIQAGTVNQERPAPIQVGQGETVLVVEDEPAILTMTSRMLSGLGYTVLTASSPAEAIDIAHAHAAGLDLLLTDVVMPDMTGRDLAELLLLSHPHLKCLYMSGYAENIIASHGILEERYHFIQKPFSVRELSIRVHASLST